MLDLAIATDTFAAGTGARQVASWRDDAGTVFAAGFVDGATRWIEWRGLGVFTFGVDSRVVTLYPSSPAGAEVAYDIFSRVVQPIILQALGGEVLHASAVAGPRGVIALAGTTGHGKSTTAWALGCRAGFQQIADDAVALEGFDRDRPAATIQVRPLPYVSRLRRPLPTGAPAAPPSAGRPGGPIRLHAVVLLEQTNTAGRTAGVPERLHPAGAFRHLLPHAYCFDDTDQVERRRLTRHYLDLAATVPVFRLCYRPDLAAIDGLLDAIVSATASAECGARHG